MLPFRESDRIIELDDSDLEEADHVEADFTGAGPAGAHFPAFDGANRGVAERPLHARSTLPTPGALPRGARSPHASRSLAPASEREQLARATSQSPTRKMPTEFVKATATVTSAGLTSADTSEGRRARAHREQDQDYPHAERGSRIGVDSPVRARSSSNVTPSPFARSFAAVREHDAVSEARAAKSTPPALHLLTGASGASGASTEEGVPDARLSPSLAAKPESIAPVTFSSGFSSTFSDTPASRRALDAAALAEAREIAELSRGSAPMIFRGLGLMLAGGVVAASLTIYLVRNEGPERIAASPVPAMASIALPQNAVEIGSTAPPQVETRPGARALGDPRVLEGAAHSAEKPEKLGAPAADVKFDEDDTVVIATEAPTDHAKSSEPGGPKPERAQAAARPSGPQGSAPSGSSGTPGPRKTTAPATRAPLPPNALLPD